MAKKKSRWKRIKGGVRRSFGYYTPKERQERMTKMREEIQLIKTERSYYKQKARLKKIKSRAGRNGSVANIGEIKRSFGNLGFQPPKKKKNNIREGFYF